MTSVTAPSPSRQLVAAAIVAVLVVATATTGALSSTSTAADYQQLRQPSWAPPSWVFGPVWTVLYVCIGVAAWLVWRSPPSVARTRALVAWLIQLVLNAAWTPIFFGARLFGLAFVEVCLLWLAVGVCAALFLRAHRRVAAALLLPYWLWTTFAAALTFAVWQLN